MHKTKQVKIKPVFIDNLVRYIVWDLFRDDQSPVRTFCFQLRVSLSLYLRFVLLGSEVMPRAEMAPRNSSKVTEPSELESRLLSAQFQTQSTKSLATQFLSHSSVINQVTHQSLSPDE